MTTHDNFIPARIVVDADGTVRPVRTFPSAYDAHCAAKGLGLHTLTADSAVDANGGTFVLAYLGVRAWGWVTAPADTDQDYRCGCGRRIINDDHAEHVC